MDNARLDRNQTGRSHSRYVAIAIMILLAVAVTTVTLRYHGAQAEVAAAPQPDKTSADVIEVTPDQLKQIRVEGVRDQDIDLDLETTGKVGFNEDRMTPVFAPYNGRVLEVLANKGDVVKAGQTLLVVESPDLVATIHDLAEAHSDADRAKIVLDAAEKGAARARNLHSLDALATKELQAAESDLARAQGDYQRATAAVSVMRNKLFLFGKSPDEIRKLEEGITDQIDRRIQILAPIAGTIVDRKVGPGQYIKPDAPESLFLIGDLSTVWVNVDIYETYLEQIHVGAPVVITVDAYPEKQFPARIAAINPTVDPTTRAIHVRCSVPNPRALLKPEMFANIRVGDSLKRKVQTVPATAVLTQGTDTFVLREESAGRFRRQQVKSGREIHGSVVIEQGLTSNDRVVTIGTLLLSNGLGGK